MFGAKQLSKAILVCYNVNMRVKLSGMTLIELLVSLAIIILLTAVALPIFSSFQRRNTLNLDTRNLEQLFYYSRTLNNNPSYGSRDYGATNADKRYGIKITPSKNKATLYPINNTGDVDTSKEIDNVKLDSRETLEFRNNVGGKIDGNLIVYISGDPPNETVSCKREAVYTGVIPPQPDCSQAIYIRISMPGVANPKMISIFGTYPAWGQKFNIRVN